MEDQNNQNLIMLQWLKLLPLQDSQIRHYVSTAIKRKSNASKHHPDKEDFVKSLFKTCAIVVAMCQINPKTTLSNLRPILSMQEFPHTIKWTTWQDKLIISEDMFQIQMLELLKILLQESILREKACRPFWTPAYRELSEQLPLLTRIDSPDLDSKSSLISSVQQVDKLSSLTITKTKNIQMNKNLQKTSCPSPMSLLADKWVKGDTSQKQKSTKKKRKSKVDKNEEVDEIEEKIPSKYYAINIGVNIPEASKPLLLQWFTTFNFVYNKAVHYVRERPNETHDVCSLRSELVTLKTRTKNEQFKILSKEVNTFFKRMKKFHVFNEVEQNRFIEAKNELKALPESRNESLSKWELKTPKCIRDEAIRDFEKARQSAFANYIKGNIGHFYMDVKPKTQMNLVFDKKIWDLKRDGFELKISAGKKIRMTFKSDIKKIFALYEDKKLAGTCRLIKERTKWTLVFSVRYENTILNKDISDMKGCGIDLGIRKFATVYDLEHSIEYKQRREEIQKQIRKILSMRLRQGYNQRENYPHRRTNSIKRRLLVKAETRLKSLVNVLHWSLIKDLVDKYDVIGLGDIQSSKIMEGDLRKFTKVEFQSLSFYTFKQRLMYKAERAGKKVFLVNEAYTSQGCTECGMLYKVGSNEVYNCKGCNISYDRDQGSARTMYMKMLLSK